jgi:hypothetical protein
VLFWESGGEEKKLGADFGFKSQQRNFGEIRKFLVKSEGNELPFRQEKTRKWRAQISANAIKILTTDSNPVANNGNGKIHLLRVGWRKIHVRISLIFSRIISFMLFTVLLSHMYFFRRISESQFTS